MPCGMAKKQTKKRKTKQKIKNRATIWCSNPTPGHISGEDHNSKRHMHPNVPCSTIYNSQDMEINCFLKDISLQMFQFKNYNTVKFIFLENPLKVSDSFLRTFYSLAYIQCSRYSITYKMLQWENVRWNLA